MMSKTSYFNLYDKSLILVRNLAKRRLQHPHVPPILLQNTSRRKLKRNVLCFEDSQIFSSFSLNLPFAPIPNRCSLLARLSACARDRQNRAWGMKILRRNRQKWTMYQVDELPGQTHVTYEQRDFKNYDKFLKRSVKLVEAWERG
jgi:hypothetical protein